MCLAIPAQVVSVDSEDMATVALEGIKKPVSTALLDDVTVGDYLLVHVGYALHKLSEEEAARTLELMAEAGVLAEELEELASSQGAEPAQ
ncbi:HypC/HybG/HupF family hydrogenase formation chaperone [Roseibium denhamense]|uniref:Hydrogenase maturation protein HypC n=1 Tax=Roseibium denhamense TaxID=76305 RepID=A0ABY1NHF7_9HYPH|nr:HypC/HybG/HupF family hydrogenase formation chaperone [Roseibium denhamense]MTI06492.1 HypC/HybG/HupF family hydrogenase formation chaperone [Roseibium denhamense]SMP09544.1 Hydrogenase maturation protein HypC [Roseibium denhamense]